MRLKTHLLRKVIDYDLIPCSIKWRKSVSGIGRLMRIMQENYGAEGAKKLSQVMYNTSVNQAKSWNNWDCKET